MVKRRTLTREKVLEQANQLIAQRGLEHLTIRALATALDVRPQSLYNYVSSVTDLFDQVGRQFIQEISDHLMRELMGVSGREALMVFARVFREECLRQQHLAPMLLNPNALPDLTETHAALVTLYHRMFASLNLEDTGNTRLVEVTLYRSTLFGFIMQEIGGFLKPTELSVDDRFTQTMTLAIAQLRLQD